MTPKLCAKLITLLFVVQISSFLGINIISQLIFAIHVQVLYFYSFNLVSYPIPTVLKFWLISFNSFLRSTYGYCNNLIVVSHFIESICPASSYTFWGPNGKQSFMIFVPLKGNSIKMDMFHFHLHNK